MKILKFSKFVVVILLLIPFLLTGCFLLKPKPIMCDSPLCVGFNYYYGGATGGEGAVAVKGDRLEFDVDDVVLDWYYGYISEPGGVYIPPNYTRIGFGLYFVKSESQMPDYDMRIEDYHFVENMYLQKYMTQDEYLSKEYQVTETKEEGRVFQQHSLFKIPSQLFTEPNREVMLQNFIIYYSQEENMYRLSSSRGGGVTLHYKFTGEKTIKFLKV